MALLFPLFVYGTLKKGFTNYDRHCASAVQTLRAFTWGRLYELDVGYPLLEVPDPRIQAIGTKFYKMDANNTGKQLNFEQPAGDWDLVEGELMYFSDPENEIPPIDYLEQFNGQEGGGMYDRVLLTVKTDEGALVNAWTYIINNGRHSGTRLSLNGQAIVNWLNHRSGYIDPDSHACSSA